MLGRTLSHYRIVEQLGAGGMGVVYRAEDLTLGRPVALKFLPEAAQVESEDRSRLIHEARAAAALLHPNICPIYDVGEADGQAFIAMAYLEGETLKSRLGRGPLLLGEALAIARQVGEALAAAHAKGIVHRDVKPANVMLTGDGRAVLMDFGLAKVTGATRLTRTGTTLGTAAYMSPEQVQGGEVDGQTDVWALGVLLYEMVSGRVPFRGDYEPALAYAIVHEEVEPLSTVGGEIPAGLDGVLGKALAKRVGERYASVGELVADLEVLQADRAAFPAGRLRAGWRRRWRRWTLVQRLALVGTVAVVVAGLVYGGLKVMAARAGIDSLAVLPVRNVSGDVEQEWLADGVTEALINELGRVGSLRVISRTSVMTYKGQSKPVPEIARELGVQAVVEASVVRVGEQVRVTAQLIRARPERQLWAQRYERDLRDVLTLYGEMAQEIAGEVRAKLTAQQQKYLATVRKVDPEAYELVLKGRYYVASPDMEGIRRGQEYFQRALDIDPTSAEAYAGLALCYYWSGHMNYRDAKEAAALGKSAAMKALALDDGLAQAHVALGLIHFTYDWDWQGAERELRCAIELNPNLAEARYAYGYFLVAMSRFDDAVLQAHRAVALDPLAPYYQLMLGYVLLYSKRIDDAIAQYDRLLKIAPDYTWGNTQRAWAYSQLLQHDQACADCEKGIAGHPDDPIVLGSCGWVFARAGRVERARAILADLLSRSEREYVDPFNLALVYDGVGEVDSAMVQLERARNATSPGLVLLNIECWSEAMRADPRFEDLVRRLGLFPASK